MAGLLLAGALQGFGQGWVERAQNIRDEAMKQMEREWQVQDREDRQTFDAEQNALSREHDTAEREAGYAHEQDVYDRNRADTLSDQQAERDRDTAEEKAVADTLRERYVAPDPQSQFNRDNVTPEALAALGRLERISERTFTVNSAYRDEEKNLEVGGANHSQHLEGDAFDIDTSDMSEEQKAELIRQARAAGFGGIGVYQNNLHFDTGPQRDWGPSYSHDTTPAWAADALKTNVGEGVPDGLFDIIADDEASPQAREAAQRGLDPTYTGSDLSTSSANDSNVPTRQFWRNNGDGTRTRMATYGDGSTKPVIDESTGKPIVEDLPETNAERKAADQPADLPDELDVRAERDLADVDNDAQRRRIYNKIDELIDGGMDADMAYEKVLGAIQITIPAEDGYFSDTPEHTAKPGDEEFDWAQWDGTFAGLDGDKVDQAVTEERVAPGSGGIPTVQNDDDYKALPSGATFRDPEGNLRKKP